MSKLQTLCEFLAESGGLRSFRNQRDTMGASDLRGIGADNWHKAKPFRKKLVRLDSGMCPDDAALAAWEAGYFPNHLERPDVQDLIDAIDSELAGSPVYTLDDQREIFEAEMAAWDREANMAALHDLAVVPVAQVAQAVPGRVIPAEAEVMTGMCGEVAYLYEQIYINKKGHEGRRYLVKAFRAGERKPDLHKVYVTHDQRIDAINEFFATSMEFA